jgi:hypothetical protein
MVTITQFRRRNKFYLKDACKKYLFEVAAEYAKSHYGFASYGCGFCQTGVPCEAGIPRGLASEKL